MGDHISAVLPIIIVCKLLSLYRSRSFSDSCIVRVLLGVPAEVFVENRDDDGGIVFLSLRVDTKGVGLWLCSSC
jgi:hypothetical protein